MEIITLHHSVGASNLLRATAEKDRRCDYIRCDGAPYSQSSYVVIAISYESIQKVQPTGLRCKTEICLGLFFVPWLEDRIMTEAI